MRKFALIATSVAVVGFFSQTSMLSSESEIKEIATSTHRSPRNLASQSEAQKNESSQAESTKSLSSTAELFSAVELGNWDQILDYLLAGGNPDIRDSEGRSLLFWAAMSGEITALKALIQSGADLELQDFSGRTALMAATLQSRDEALELLIEAGARIDSTNEVGQTPIHMAVEVSSAKSLDRLIAAGADIAAKFGELEMDSYLLATNNGDRQMMDELIERYPAFVDSTDREGRSASHYACAEGDIEAAATYLRHGGRLDRTDLSGRNAFAYALDEGSDACVAFAEEAGLSDYL